MDLTNPIIKVIKTADGSNTLYHEQYNEIYHSRHGAYQESMHVFIEAGLKHIETLFGVAETVNILEVGFGTGLNCILSYIHKKNKLDYTGVDVLPIQWSVIKQLGYPQFLAIEKVATVYQQIIEAPWDKIFLLNNWFTLTKLHTSLFDLSFRKKFHLIYFDAFAPTTQAAMWQKAVFEKLYTTLIEGGCLVTYCAKGVVRRNMQQAGFEVEKIPGPPGKREMLRAKKIISKTNSK